MRLRHLSLILAAATIAPAAQAGAATHPARACSTAGLRFSFKSGSATFSDKVVRLRARNVRCRTARVLARRVAKDLLHGRQVPHKIDGLTIRVKSPCAGCAPDWKVSATHGGSRVTFHVLGGA